MPACMEDMLAQGRCEPGTCWCLLSRRVLGSHVVRETALGRVQRSSLCSCVLLQDVGVGRAHGERPAGENKRGGTKREFLGTCWSFPKPSGC